MSWGCTGRFCSNSLNTAISLPSLSSTWLTSDPWTALASGRVAGRGRNTNAAITVINTASGAITEHTITQAAARSVERITGGMSGRHPGMRAGPPHVGPARTLGFVRRPPSVDAIARELANTGLPHPLLVDAARSAVAAGDPETAVSRAREEAEAVARALLRPVINATGVLLHTNLGRAPIAASVEPRPSNLELDLATGRRGSRQRSVARLLAQAAGAAGALVG